MKEALKYALIAAGSLLAASYFGLFGPRQTTADGSAAGSGPPEQGSAGSGSTPNDSPTSDAGAGSQAQPAGMTLLDLMKIASGANARGFDEWNWYYRQLTGRPGPAPEDVGIARVDPMPLITAEQWAAALIARGVPL